MKFTCSVPCLFGLEGLTADELRRMKMSDVTAENGRVLFSASPADIVRANLRLRTGERILIRLGAFPAHTFTELFDGTKAIPFEDLIPKTGQFPVKGHCLSSQLHAVPSCQAIIKKAIATRLGEAYHLARLPENGALYQIQFSIMKDYAEIFLDTTGAGLHKRGYRAVGNAAPLRETLAAGMVQLSRYRGRDLFLDPFCGSGTIAIEAALTAINRAPGMNRTFSCAQWPQFGNKLWTEAKDEAKSLEYHGNYRIRASDIDPNSISIAKNNAKKAGVAELIDFSVSDARTLVLPEEKSVIVTNPPYGERMLEQKEAAQLIREFGRQLFRQRDFSLYLISSDEELERNLGHRAKKKRKLYNGMIRCNLYMYF